MCLLIAFPAAAFLILIVCLYTYYLTNKMLGPYERIIRELDAVLETRQKKELTVREGDDMFRDLLKRINALIRQLPD
jgi:Na+/melibiose symporter-like transporter